MALDKFRAAPLPNPPMEYDPQYIRQMIRVLETYFSQLDSRAANNAEQYSANRFVGGTFEGAFPSLTTTEKNLLTPVPGTVIYDATLDKLCVYTPTGWETITSV